MRAASSLALVGLALLVVIGAHSSKEDAEASSKDYVAGRKLTALSDRARGLREVAATLVEDVRQFASRTRDLEKQTSLITNHAKEDNVGLREHPSKLRLLTEDLSACNAKVCQATCEDDCAFLCGNTVFIRPAKCDRPQFCRRQCSYGCSNSPCTYRFSFSPVNGRRGRRRRHR
jgi:hypothetical protein